MKGKRGHSEGYKIGKRGHSGGCKIWKEDIVEVVKKRRMYTVEVVKQDKKMEYVLPSSKQNTERRLLYSTI